MPRWYDANGMRVEVIVMRLVGDQGNLNARALPPCEGEQFSVTHPGGFHAGYYRTVADLAASGKVDSRHGHTRTR